MHGHIASPSLWSRPSPAEIAIQMSAFSGTGKQAVWMSIRRILCAEMGNGGLAALEGTF